MTTYLGLGVALPHVRVKTSRRYILAIGRSRAGIRHHGRDVGRAGAPDRDADRRATRRATPAGAGLDRPAGAEQELVDGFVNAPDLDTSTSG
jgi:diadenylate cyclase